MHPQLDQIVKETTDFFFSYKPLILAAMVTVPSAIGYGIIRLFETPTAEKYFDRIAQGLIKLGDLEMAAIRYIRKRF